MDSSLEKSAAGSLNTFKFMQQPSPMASILGFWVGPFGLCKKGKRKANKFAAASSAINVLRRTRRNL